MPPECGTVVTSQSQPMIEIKDACSFVFLLLIRYIPKLEKGEKERRKVLFNGYTIVAWISVLKLIGFSLNCPSESALYTPFEQTSQSHSNLNKKG